MSTPAGRSAWLPTATSGTLFVSDQNNQRVLALQVSGLDLNTPFVSLDAANALVTVDVNGIATALPTRVASPHGLDFVGTPVPEPASLATLAVGLLGLLGFRRSRA